MKVSYNWLKELVDLESISFEQLVDDLSLYSIEVDGVEKVTVGSNIVVGYVESKEKHPNADKLSVCLVNIGNETKQIVCGAPNVRQGQKIMLALPGAVLAGGVIKESIIRGVASSGMICALSELNLEHKYIPEKYADGIYVLDDDAPLGVDAIKYLGLDDVAIELGITPNRMDLLSMRGVANDVSAMYNRTRFDEFCCDYENKTLKDIKVEIDTPNCYSYYAKVIKNVKITESPNYIKARLIASGIRPINNVVDITNYILMLFGQPLHAFDMHELGNHIKVRQAFENEEVITLDGQLRKLSVDDIVITDGKKPVCLAGVMGCSNTEVTTNTKDIVLEAAVFRDLSIRKTSSRLGLRSESSIRFERGVDLNQTLQALNYACYLLAQYANGEVAQGYAHQGITHIDDKKISISEKELFEYLGIKIKKADIVDICTRLGFIPTVIGNTIEVMVPNRRLDVVIKQDLIEEIARIYGYNKIAETLPVMDVSGSLTLTQEKLRKIKNTLSQLGLKEVITYSLVDKNHNESFKVIYPENATPYKLLNPMSEDHSLTRLNLVTSLIDVVKYNSARKLKDINIFEIGSRYYQTDELVEECILSLVMSGEYAHNKWQQHTENVDFFLVKGILNTLFKRLNVEIKYQKLTEEIAELHPEKTAGLYYNKQLIGYLGALHPEYTQKNNLNDTYVCEIILTKILEENPKINYKPISKVPAVERDLAFVIDDNQPVGEIIEAIYKTDTQMISQVVLFDIYKGEHLKTGYKSVAFRITLEADETLTEAVISQKMQRIIKMIEYRYNGKLRD